MDAINLHTPINTTGYGNVGKNVLINLDKLVNVHLDPIGSIDIEYKWNSLINKCLSTNKSNTTLSIWHQWDFHRLSQFQFGFPFFELNTLNQKEVESINSLDSVLVTSHWGKQVLLNNNIKCNIHVVPLGIDPTIFYEQPTEYNEKLIFINIGKWEYRKGHDIIPSALIKSGIENYELWMMCDNPFLSKSQTEIWKNYYINTLGNKVKFFNRVKNHEDVADLIRQADCGIFPYRAEGWNLDLLECMAMGKTVIATNYSAPTEYLNSQNCLLLETKSYEPAFDGTWFFGGEWAKIDTCFDQLVEHIRYVYKIKQDGYNLYNVGGVLTSKKFTWNNTCENILKVINA